MSVSQNNITVVVNQQDADGVDILKRVIGALGYAGAAGEFDTRTAPDTNQHTLDLPITTVRQLLIHNTHASGILTIVGTPTGGASVTLAKLGPGDLMIVWTTTAFSDAGYSDLKYTADTLSTTFEMFLGG
jgi:hypothetical protein